MGEQQEGQRVAIRLYYDFASTLCYAAHRILSGVEDRIEALGAELEWCPIDLTMIVPWNRGDSFVEEVRDTVHATVRGLGLEVEMPDPWLDSRPASNVALAVAGSRESEARWRSAVFESIFELGEVGLTPELLTLAQELTGNDDLATWEPVPESAPVAESTRGAILLGVNGVPTFLLDDLVFGGVHDADTMVEVVRQLLERHRSGDGGTVN